MKQGRQDSNLQPPVLETGALPIELRPWVARGLYSWVHTRFARPCQSRGVSQRRALGLLFSVLATAFAAIAVASAWGSTAPRRLVVAAGAAAIALWLGSLALSALRNPPS